jgi:chemotaxis protein CheD
METAIEVLRVGIAESKLAQAPVRLRTTGLGSCVGVVVWDPLSRVAGLLHVMLPEAPSKPEIILDKYADSGVRHLLEQLREAGVAVRQLRAKLAGGAQMFAPMGSDLLKIGPRNVEAVKSALLEYGIPVLAEDIGGNVGRTIEFDPLTERLEVKTALNGTISI